MVALHLHNTNASSVERVPFAEAVVMQWCLKKLLFLAGVAALTSQVALAEATHNSGGTFNLSRPQAGQNSSSAKRLSDAVNACSLGRGGSLLTGINPGLGQIGTGIGAAGGTGGGGFQGSGVPTGGAAAGAGAGGAALSLFQGKCTSCHGPKDPAKSIQAIQGRLAVPQPMQAALARMSAQEKQQIIGFLQTR